MFTAKDRGYDIDLYRSRENRWISGVCAGLAENMQWSPMGVRIGFIFLLMFSGAFALFGYIAAIFLIASRPYERQDTVMSQTEKRTSPHNLKEKVLNKENSATRKAAEIKERLAQIDQRIRAIEKHVTSRKYQFERELRRGN